MKIAALLLAACSLTLGCASAVAAPIPPSTPVASARETCFILREIDGPTQIRKGGDTCARRVAPASTFKVPHALIALETGARTGPEDLERWDGKHGYLAVWDQDQTLATAMQRSVVWYFQRTAVRIGRERMVEHLTRMHYGNGLVGDDLTTFWLGAPLAISADEQADFMEHLTRRDLPFKPAVMDTVDRLILQKPGAIWRGGEAVPAGVSWDDATTKIYAKTGSKGRDGGESVRWLVGHLSSAGHAYAFVSLVTSRTEELGTDAITLAMRELQAAGLVSPRIATAKIP